MRRLRSLAVELWFPIAIVAIWWFASLGSTSPYWPPLKTIVSTFVDTWLFDRFFTDLVPSLWRFSLGFVLALVIGVGIGLLLGLVSSLRRAFEPIIDFLRSLPKPALVPILIVLLGIDWEMKVFIIAFSAIWPILLNTIDGVRAVEPDMVAMSRIYGLSRRELVTRIVLPAASPQIFVGARLSLAIALILMVISEMLASTDGLGYFILLSQQTFAIPEMWAGIIMLGIVGYVTNVGLVLVERRVLAWHRGWRAASLGAQVPQKARRRSKATSSTPSSSAERTATTTSASTRAPVERPEESHA